MVLIPKKLAPPRAPGIACWAARSGRVGIAATAVAYAAAAVSWSAAIDALLALACSSHAKYGACAVTYCSALGPSHAPACTPANTAMRSSAVSAYAVLNDVHDVAAASS